MGNIRLPTVNMFDEYKYKTKDMQESPQRLNCLITYLFARLSSDETG